jgi:hypothetical protein
MLLYLLLVDPIRALVIGSSKLLKPPTSKLDLPATIGHNYLRSPYNGE